MLLKALIFYLAIINIITFILFGIDKFKAIKNRYRIPEFTLILFCFLFGSLGGIFGMYVFRHKTLKPKFFITVPLLLLLQIGAIIWFLGCYYA